MIWEREHFSSKLQSCSTAVRPESLNPTCGSASFHSLRVYHQVQDWLGNALDPTKCSWKVVGGKLYPIYMSKSPASKKLLKIIRCGCKTDCSKKTCTCFKYGLTCTETCTICRGISCLNVERMEEDADANLESSVY